METAYIIIVDDDKEIGRMIRELLIKNQYKAQSFDSAEAFLKHYETNKKFDLLVLDMMLPGMSGIELCKQLRLKADNTPIIMLTAMTDDIEKILSLEIGADDYLTKPFNPRELIARIKAILRRVNYQSEQENGAVENTLKNKLLQFADWCLNTATRQLYSPENIEVSLSGRSYDLLIAFLEHPQQVLTRDQLLTILSNRTAEPFDRSVDVQISRLRMKLNDDPKNPKLIKTLRSGGYMWATSVKRS